MTDQRSTPRVGWVTWAGLAVVLAAAAVLSFHALRDLGLAVSIPASLAWLLPIAVDAGAAVSCATWLSRRAPADATAWARGQTWTLLVLTVVGNAAGLGMHAAEIVPPWWVAVLVGAIPPAVVGGCVHLAVLVGRQYPTVVGDPVGKPTDATAKSKAGSAPERDEPSETPFALLPVEPVVDESDQPDRPSIEPPLTDAEIIADVREHAVGLGRRPSRDEMLERYRIGATRARRLRNVLGWIDPVDEPDRQPTGAAS